LSRAPAWSRRIAPRLRLVEARCADELALDQRAHASVFAGLGLEGALCAGERRTRLVDLPLPRATLQLRQAPAGFVHRGPRLVEARLHRSRLLPHDHGTGCHVIALLHRDLDDLLVGFGDEFEPVALQRAVHFPRLVLARAARDGQRGQQDER
jgi:hypothetical protein